MKKIIKIITGSAVLFLLIQCNVAEKKEAQEIITEAEVKDFIIRYDGSWSDRDTNRMKQLMDTQYLYFSSTGSVFGRQNIMGWFDPPDKYKIDSAKRSEIGFIIDGNTAIVNSRWIGGGSFGNEKFRDDQRCGLVLHKKDGRIRIIAEHCTQIVD
ncbi:MAG TPA: nuclear transport factor 2 family protein [Chitinophagaceae bacterium]|nr:nuclear transport factor 2 family protein [Chitinophagaceae bacterium]